VTAPIAAPAPVVEPVNPNPEPPPPVEVPPPVVVGEPPAPPPPAPPPQPAEGTYILGRIVKAALLDQRYFDLQAQETSGGNPVPNGLRVTVNFYTTTQEYGLYSYPTNGSSLDKYPYGAASFKVGFSDEGWFTLGRLAQGTSNVAGRSQKQTAMVRQGGDFEIRDDYKFIIDTTAAEWRGTELDQNAFIQLQIGSYPQSNTAFLLCQHQSFGDVRRRACTIHSRDTGQKRGVAVIDDSRNLGPIEYLPVQ
jgi:hypothetical protein